MPALAIRTAPGLAVADLVDSARSYAEQAQAPNTARAYATDLRDFAVFCAAHALCSFPADPQTVGLYATALAARVRVSTLRRHLAAISGQHKRRGLESPCAHPVVREIIAGIARSKGTAVTKKDALTLEPLQRLLAAIDDDDVAAWRDRAILLLGFAAALRRSEIAALRVEDLRFVRRGLLVRIVRSKTDQTRQGTQVAIPTTKNSALCAVYTVRQYLQTARITRGPLFRSLTFARQLTDREIDGRDVANLVRRLVKRAGLAGNFSAHSLRAGFATAAARAKVPLDAIARTTRHKSLPVLMGYIRPTEAFDDVALTTMMRRATPSAASRASRIRRNSDD